MTTQQIEWAKTHDWFQSSQQLPDSSFVVWCNSKRPEGGLVPFTDINKLIKWAGY
jgi:hypothetical protein